ncbi:MAG: tRNA-dihydrouridine synthase [Thermomicrobiales bacterium]
MGNIWRELPQPIFILAPMEDVTDSVFRRIIAKNGAPDLFFTEFTYVEGLMSKGRKPTSHRFVHTDAEQPLIAQIWGAQPKNFYAVARDLASGEFGPFAGIDLNMGCPERKVVRRGSCAGLIEHPAHAIEIIRATQEGAGDLPVSVKTRCGTTSWVTETWAETLLNENLAALTIHGRIASEQSKFPARWEEIEKVVALRDRLGKETLIIGNGDVASHADGLEKAARHGVDGVMVGRGIFKNLWFFDPRIDPETISLLDRIDLLIEHIRLWKATWSEGQKNFEATKKMYKAYFACVPNTSELVRELLLLKTADETLDCLAAARMRFAD